jgi:hypothetical protein
MSAPKPFSQYWDCSDDLNEIMWLSPVLLLILADAITWAEQRHLFVRVTSLLREMNDGISVSTTHQEGRALDISVKGWSQQNIEELSKYLNDKYAPKLGTSPVGKAPLVCVYHNNGNGWHFHIQVRRGASLLSLKIN